MRRILTIALALCLMGGATLTAAPSKTVSMFQLKVEIKDSDGIDTMAVGTRPDDRAGAVEFFDAAGEPIGELTTPQQRPRK